MPAPFDELQIGSVTHLGVAAVDEAALQAFIDAFAPGWTADRGAPDSMVYALWARLASTSRSAVSRSSFSNPSRNPRCAYSS